MPFVNLKGGKNSLSEQENSDAPSPSPDKKNNGDLPKQVVNLHIHGTVLFFLLLFPKFCKKKHDIVCLQYNI